VPQIQGALPLMLVVKS